jgi:hypothetical protein
MLARRNGWYDSLWLNFGIIQVIILLLIDLLLGLSMFSHLGCLVYQLLLIVLSQVLQVLVLGFRSIK